MNKKNTRKGFTITELVIVIAVIAILAAVLIPTFSSIITKANNSAALQEARATYTEYMANVDYSTTTAKQDLVVKVSDTEWLIVNDAQMQDDVYGSKEAAYGALGVAAGGEYVVISKDNVAGTTETVPAA